MNFALSFVAVLVTLLTLAESCSQGQIRLYDNGGSSQNKGMLQICKNGTWTAVCDYGWRQEFSVALCKTLGHTNPTPLTTPNNGSWSILGYVSRYYSTSRTPSCISSSNNILPCLTTSSSYLTYYYYRYTYCNNARDTLHIQCKFSLSTCTRGSIRLYSNETTSESNGMLQMCDSKGRWTAVCDYSWGCSESRVACRQLGFKGTSARYRYNAGSWPVFGFGPYSYCYSSYSNLTSCSSYSSYYRNNAGYCNPLRDTVFLQCSSLTNNENCSVNYEVRLVNTIESDKSVEGSVQICYRNSWTPICSNAYYYYSSQKIGNVLCNSIEDSKIVMGFSKVYTDGRFGGPTADSITRISCRQSNNIRYCSLSQQYHGCTSFCSRPLGLKCYYRSDCNEGQIRLVNGTIEREGRLEICANGVWGGFCPQNFRKSAAHVACKQAGYGDVMGAVIYTNGEFGHGDGPIIYGNVECFGHENYIADCSKSVAPNFTCNYGSSVALLCRDNCSEGSVRLSGGRHSYEGFVEVCVDGLWTLVADSGWGNSDARVVCRQLKAYGTSAGEAVENSTLYTRPKKATRYSNVYCRGNEEMLEDCRHHTIEINEGKKYDGPIAAVDCKVTISITSSTKTQTSSTSTTIITIEASQTPTTQAQSLTKDNSILGSGVAFFVLGIAIFAVSIAIFACILIRTRKSTNTKGYNNDKERMSNLKEDNYDTVNPLAVSTITLDQEGDEDLLK